MICGLTLEWHMEALAGSYHHKLGGEVGFLEIDFHNSSCESAMFVTISSVVSLAIDPWIVAP